MVAGLDGTAAVGGRVGSLSTAPDQALFRRMRQIADIVLVGAETVRREGYGPVRLDKAAQAARRELGQSSNPPLAVVSRSLTFDWGAKVFAETSDDGRTHVITCATADPDRLAEAGKVAEVIVAGDDRVEPAAAQVITLVRAPSVASAKTLALQSKASDLLTTASGGVDD